MMMSLPIRTLFVIACLLGHGATAQAGAVAVRYPEGVTQGFLSAHAVEGDTRGDGELRQTATGEDRLVSRLVFTFSDGSLQDETVVFTQNHTLTLVSYHLIQRGPSFPLSLDVSFERKSGVYTVRSKRRDEEEEVRTGQVEMPADLYNGMIVTALKNLPPGSSTTVHFLTFNPEPTLYEMEIEPAVTDQVTAGTIKRQATHYVMRPKISHWKQFFARLFKRHVPAYHFWILTKDVPAFVRFEGELALNGPPFEIEVTPPKLPADAK